MSTVSEINTSSDENIEESKSDSIIISESDDEDYMSLTNVKRRDEVSSINYNTSDYNRKDVTDSSVSANKINTKNVAAVCSDTGADYEEDTVLSKNPPKGVKKIASTIRERQHNVTEICSDISEDERSALSPTSLLSDEDDDEIIPSRRIRKQRVIIHSDESDEYDEDERALSPKTRLSITGIRPKDLLSDSESEYETTEENSGSTNAKSNSECGSSRTAEEGTTIQVNDITETTKICNNPHKKQQKLNILSPLRYSEQFEKVIKEHLSSTMYKYDSNKVISVDQEHETVQSSDDSDIQVISKEISQIELSSTDESHKLQESESKVSPQSVKNVTKTTTLITYVSQEYYAKQLKKMDDLKLEISNAEILYQKIAQKLPDGGLQLRNRIQKLQNDLMHEEQLIKTLAVEDAVNAASSFGNMKEKYQQLKEECQAAFSKNVPDWKELSAAVNAIQPMHTGRQGMQTFQHQKALTMERLKTLHGSLETCPDENVLADDPKGLKVNLMPHQKHALAWMNWREKQKPRGGILADDMGLGKTLTMISLILDCKNRVSDKSSSEDDVADEDYGGRNIKHFYQGETLVVCPASLLRQWESEVNSKLSRHKLTVCVHHGNNRETRAKHLRTYDIVITTYNIVSREHKCYGALFGVKWKRIILDEAHIIRNHKAQSSLAACALRGKCRWALTGTPIQNKEMDVYALLKFLRCTPFDDLAHWKKWIDKSAGGQQRLNTIMKSLMLRRTKMQLQEIGSLQSLPEKTLKLIEVTLEKEEMNVYQIFLIYSRTLFVQYLCQRGERNSDVMYSTNSSHPPRLPGNDLNNIYYKLHEKFKKMHHGSKEIKSHEILELLLRLRQICCHPGLISAKLDNQGSQSFDVDSDAEKEQIDLLEQLNKLAITDEVDDNSKSAITTKGNADTRGDLLKEDMTSKVAARVLQRNNPVFDLSKPSSKLEKVLSTVKECISNNRDKVIIVSQWTSVLDIINNYLERKGTFTLSLNGTVPVHKRQDIIKEFDDPNSHKRVLLLSLTAGGVGLNLSSANHLLLVDWHWNPQLEAQAQDRIYRMGQKKHVIIYKFMCKDTIEANIKALQERKLDLANQVLTGVQISGGTKLTIDEMKNLFGI